MIAEYVVFLEHHFFGLRLALVTGDIGLGWNKGQAVLTYMKNGINAFYHL
jgi:hypothetical protein